MAEAACRRAFAGFELHSVAVTASTQDVVRAAARRGVPAGYCCLAASQRAGRGRQGRRWVAPASSSLLASLLVRVQHSNLGAVPIAAGVAARAAIASTSGCQASLKWPNDIIVGDRKLAGVLCEVEAHAPHPGTAVVVGIGVNLRVEAFPDGVRGISLHELTDRVPSPRHLLAATIAGLAARLEVLDRDGSDAINAEWLEHAAGIGTRITAESSAGVVSGIAEGIDADGALRVRTAGGSVRVIAGDVHILPGEQPR